jgi:hypothetical protein
MFKPNLKILIPLVIVPGLTFILTRPKQNLTSETKVISTDQFRNLTIFKPFSSSIIPITILIATYIILTLLTVVKIRKINQGPLRIV